VVEFSPSAYLTDANLSRVKWIPKNPVGLSDHWWKGCVGGVCTGHPDPELWDPLSPQNLALGMGGGTPIGTALAWARERAEQWVNASPGQVQRRAVIYLMSVALRVARGAFTWPGKRGSTIRRPSPPLNAGTAEPLRVSPPEAVAYPLELQSLHLAGHSSRLVLMSGRV